MAPVEIRAWLRALVWDRTSTWTTIKPNNDLSGTRAMVKIAHFEKTLSVRMNRPDGDPRHSNSNAGNLPYAATDNAVTA
jgi:hypothetical protein